MGGARRILLRVSIGYAPLKVGIMTSVNGTMISTNNKKKPFCGRIGKKGLKSWFCDP